MELAIGIRRETQIEGSATPDTFKVKVEKLVGRLHFVILFGVIKPTRPQRHIAFRGNPIFPIALPTAQKPVIYVARRSLSAVGTNGRECRPRCFRSDALFVAYPADIRANIAKYNSRRLHVTGNGPCLFFPMVINRSIDAPRFIGTSVITVSPIRAVVPADKQLAIAAV